MQPQGLQNPPEKLERPSFILFMLVCRSHRVEQQTHGASRFLNPHIPSSSSLLQKQSGHILLQAGSSSTGGGIDAAALQQEILEMVRGFVGADVAVDQPLVAQGLDSLAGMELRQKLQVQR